MGPFESNRSELGVGASDVRVDTARGKPRARRSSPRRAGSLASDGTLAGTPTYPGDYELHVAVSDAAGATATKTLALHVEGPRSKS